MNTELDNNVNENIDNHITVTDDTGNKYTAEVYDIFKVDGYDGDYIIYSFGEVVDQDNEKVYVSKIVESQDDFTLSEIQDEAEWEAVNNTIQKNIESLGEV